MLELIAEKTQAQQRFSMLSNRIGKLLVRPLQILTLVMLVVTQRYIEVDSEVRRKVVGVV
jgi:hypothetical protein